MESFSSSIGSQEQSRQPAALSNDMLCKLTKFYAKNLEDTLMPKQLSALHCTNAAPLSVLNALLQEGRRGRNKMMRVIEESLSAAHGGGIIAASRKTIEIPRNRE